MSFDQNNKTKRKNSTEEHDVKLLTTFQGKKKKSRHFKLCTSQFAHAHGSPKNSNKRTPILEHIIRIQTHIQHLLTANKY